jgi:hypothetical protein
MFVAGHCNRKLAPLEANMVVLINGTWPIEAILEIGICAIFQEELNKVKIGSKA